MTQSNTSVVFTDIDSVAVDTRTKPTVGPDEVLIESITSMISTGTELTVLDGEGAEGSEWDDYYSFPFVPGYNNIGRVRETGSDVSDKLVGKRVATWREHQQYVTTEPSSCRVVPPTLDAEAASLFSLAEVAMNGVRQSGLEWGDTAVVYGLGLVGQLAARVAYHAGARPVIAVEPSAQRRALLPDAPDLLAVDPADRPVEEVVDDEGAVADVVFEVTGNADLLPTELGPLRDGGTLVLLSSPRTPTTFDFHDHCNAHSYRIVGAHVMNSPETPTVDRLWTRRRHGELFFRLVANGELAVDSLVTRTASPHDAPSVYRDLQTDRTKELGVVFDWTVV